jgi:hypothetical protein
MLHRLYVTGFHGLVTVNANLAPENENTSSIDGGWLPARSEPLLMAFISTTPLFAWRLSLAGCFKKSLQL